MAAAARTNNYMVTAGDGASSQNSQYGLLQNANNRPKPKGLPPPSMNRRDSHKSGTNQMTMSMDSQMIG